MSNNLNVRRSHNFGRKTEPPIVSVIAHAPGIEKGPEKWRPVVGYETYYEVSSWGDIRRLCSRKGRHVGTLLTQSRGADGYMTIVLSASGLAKPYLVHEIVAGGFLGPCPAGSRVNHKHPDGDKSRNWLTNLEYVASTETDRPSGPDSSHRPAPPVAPPNVPPPTPPPGPMPTHAQRLQASVAEEEAAAERRNKVGDAIVARRTRENVDWKAAGLKAWDTRRRRLTEAAAGGAA